MKEKIYHKHTGKYFNTLDLSIHLIDRQIKLRIYIQRKTYTHVDFLRIFQGY